METNTMSEEVVTLCYENVIKDILECTGEKDFNNISLKAKINMSAELEFKVSEKEDRTLLVLFTWLWNAEQHKNVYKIKY
jgi:hypothetical protein